MKSIRIICISILVVITSCQNVNKVDKPEKLLNKTEMKNLLYDMVLLDAASGVSEKRLRELDVEMLVFLSKKYGVDSNQLKENLLYYNLNFDENLEIYEKVKDSISRLERNYDSITKRRDSLRKEEIKRQDSIRKFDTVPKKQILQKVEKKN